MTISQNPIQQECHPNSTESKKPREYRIFQIPQPRKNR